MQKNKLTILMDNPFFHKMIQITQMVRNSEAIIFLLPNIGLFDNPPKRDLQYKLTRTTTNVLGERTEQTVRKMIILAEIRDFTPTIRRRKALNK